MVCSHQSLCIASSIVTLTAFLSGRLVGMANAYSWEANVASINSIEDEKRSRIIQASSGLSYTNASSECSRKALRPSSGVANFR